MKPSLLLFYVVLIFGLAGCVAPSEHLRFPSAPLQRSADAWRYDTDGDGKADFALLLNKDGRCESVAYDDDQDGHDDRVYRLADYDPDRVPHVILMLDSVPFRTVWSRYSRGDWPWFSPPVKVIPPFPSMSGVIFSTILHAPPLPGMINRYYDASRKRIDNGIVSRSLGATNPWHRRLHYDAKYWENGLSFLEPRRWYATEMARAKRAVDASPDRVTWLYIASSSGMLSRYGEQGAQEVLDQVTPFCVQLLYERQGAVKISVLADHGHNYLPGRHVDLEKILTESGFHPTNHLRDNRDVVLDADGLVNYVGLHTECSARVAAVLAQRPEVQFVTDLEGQQVVVRNAHGTSIVEQRDGRYRYRPQDGDVLGYAAVLDQLRANGCADADGFVSPKDWLTQTADHQFPDAPYRLWQAFHGLVVNPPDVMLALADGYCGGVAAFQVFIKMQSTHGGLDQVNSATFLLDMTGRAHDPLRSQDILPTILPGYLPPVRR